MSTILEIASGQIGVSCRTDIAKVKKYISVSGGDASQPEKRSWCGDFAYWVLSQAEISPLPDKWQSAPKPLSSNAIPRFLKRFAKTGNPLPGDMYYRPFIQGRDGLQNVQHVGFVEKPDDTKSGFVSTLDGNAGGANADWNLGMGGGCVSRNATPRGGPDGIHSYLLVTPAVELVGRWWVEIGGWRWTYIFTADGDAWCTDIADTRRVRFAGTWDNAGSAITVEWSKTGSVETWRLNAGLLARSNQLGFSSNKGYSLSASKIETEDRINATMNAFRFLLD